MNGFRRMVFRQWHSGITLVLVVIASVIALPHWGSSPLFAQLAPTQPSPNQAMTDYTPPFTVGVFGGIARNSHLGEFRSLPNVPTCCVQKYEPVSNFSYTAGVFAEFPVISIFSLSGRAGYAPMNVRFSQTEYIIVPSITNSPYTLPIEHSIDAALTALTLDAGVKVRVFANFALELGASSNFFILAKARQAETIASDSPVRFLDQSGKLATERNVYEGAIPSIQPQMRLYGGFEGDLPIVRRYPGDPVGIWSLGIFGRFYYPLSSISTQMNWTITSLQAGMSLKARLPYLSLTPYQ